MFAYVLNLVENDHVESGLDSSDDLNTLLEQQVACGWEDDPDRLLTGALTVTREDTGAVVAVLSWAPVPGQEWPDLLVFRVGPGLVERYRRVEREPAYSFERVA